MKIQMSKSLRISVVFGTRPEAVKLAPVVKKLKTTDGVECRVCVTGQHRQMLDQILSVFELRPDVDLDLMVPNQTLADLTARSIKALDRYFADDSPNLVLVQGDTTTVFCAALVAFYHRIPLGHVEAGLRTGDLASPWPEEANRVLTSRLTALHFAPTEGARDNLLREQVPAERIFVTGNTVIDALMWVRDRVAGRGEGFLQQAGELGIAQEFTAKFLSRNGADADPAGIHPKFLLVTGHRRESFGDGFQNICAAIRQLVDKEEDLGIIYPVHLNPNVQGPVRNILGDHPRIQLIPPVSYEPFVWLMSKAHFILSDSGGVQEEAPSLGKPVLVMRNNTERPEGIAAGTCRLVGTDPETIVRESMLLLEDPAEYGRRSRLGNPYGDGEASGRIVKACLDFLRS